LEDYEGVVEQLRLVIEADSAHSLALCRLGNYYVGLGQYEEAVGGLQVGDQRRRARRAGGCRRLYMTLCVMGERGGN
jgi:hypothetical protein